MSGFYHINPATGEVGTCRATYFTRCPFGGEDFHYPSERLARTAYEREMEEETLPQGLRKPPSRVKVYRAGSLVPPVPYSKPEPAEKATPETVELFKDMLSSLGLDLNNKDDIHRISTLLHYTFGTHKATEVSDELLIDMIDHYNAFGNAALNKAIKLAIEND